MESLLCRKACATKALSSRACTCTKLYRCWHRRSASDWQKLSLMLISSMMIYDDIMYEKLTGTDGHLGGCSRNLEQRGVQSTKRQDLLEDTRADRIYRLFLESTAIQAHWMPLDPIGMVGLRICLLCEVLKVIYLHTLSQIGSTGFPLFIKGGVGWEPLLSQLFWNTQLEQALPMS